MEKEKTRLLQPGDRVKSKNGSWQGCAKILVVCWYGKGQLLTVKTRREIFTCQAKEVKLC